MMPEFIRGVINLRGAVVPVIDLSARFGGKPSATTRRTCIVIVEVEIEQERQEVGVIVDAVNEVLEIAAGRDRAGAQFRRAYSHRLHPRHGQGRQPFRHHPGSEPCAVGG